MPVPENSPLRTALGLSRSIAQSGERWTEQAEAAHVLALADLERLERIIAWYWQHKGPYPAAVDRGEAE